MACITLFNIFSSGGRNSTTQENNTGGVAAIFISMPTKYQTLSEELPIDHE